MTTELNWIEDLATKKHKAKLVYQVRELYEEIGIMHKTERNNKACRNHVVFALDELVKAYDNSGGTVGDYLTSTLRGAIVDLMWLLGVMPDE
tara:strand:- start:407 stop:682 length:276 start_codon:yes stop_codon:yes gene_type:complete